MRKQSARGTLTRSHRVIRVGPAAACTVAPSSTNYKRKYCGLPWTTTASDLCSCQDGLVIPHPALLEESPEKRNMTSRAFRPAAAARRCPRTRLDRVMTLPSADCPSMRGFRVCAKTDGSDGRFSLAHFITSASRLVKENWTATG